FLPNPNFVPALRRRTGHDPAVVRFLRKEPETRVFLEKVTDFLAFLLPRYIKEGKSYLTIAIGCTGGRHRSALIANGLGAALTGKEVKVQARHRDLRQS